MFWNVKNVRAFDSVQLLNKNVFIAVFTGV